MVPRLSQVMEIADKLFPFELAETWDNCGIQIGDPDGTIHRIAFSLDPTPANIAFAAENHCDLLVTHHPLLMDPMKTITPRTPAGRCLIDSARAGVHVVALHTNLDAAAGGLNDELAAIIGLTNVSIPEPARCARIGQLPDAMTLAAFAGLVLSKLGLASVRLVGPEHTMVRTVFCVSGSGMGYLDHAVSYGAHVLLTGDVRYHAARDAQWANMPVVDAGHFGLERIASHLMARCFGRAFKEADMNVECLCCPHETDPFTHADVRDASERRTGC